MVSAFGREDLQTQAQEIGIEGYLLKPVSPSLLYDTLVDLFGARAPEGARSRTKKEDAHSHDFNGTRILLVEDNEVNQQVATELLESVGASVTVANHGGEALKMLMEGGGPAPFDVVFMDLQMPEMDGFTATGHIRAQPRLQALPIIAMTAHALVEERQRCLDAGMNDHVSKPIDPDALFATLTRWVKPRRAQHAAAEARPARVVEAVALPEIEGVDVKVGVARAAGNQRLYRDLLVRFAKDQRELGEQIAFALDSENSKLAERMAHTVKGVAGNLSIGKIFSSAAKLEKAIHENDPDTLVMLAEFTSLLDHQVHAIEQALPENAPQRARGKAKRSFDARKASAAASRLRELLEASDSEAPEAFQAFAAAADVVDKARLDALGTAIHKFDFESALALLGEIDRVYFQGLQGEHHDER